MFRTATGQTGTDAYSYELAAISNAQRELDARMKRLADAISDELPDDACYRMSIATESFPNAYLVADADTMRKQLAMCEMVSSFSLETIANMIRTWGQR